MKTAGNLQVAMSFTDYNVNHTQRRNNVLCFLASVTSPVLPSFFFSFLFLDDNPAFLI